MKKNKKMTCIVCPIGCQLTVEIIHESHSNMKIVGNKCPRGIVYAKEEMTHPTRIVPTTVVIENAILRRLPVKTDKPIDKNKIFDVMAALNDVVVKAPVKMGDVIVYRVLETDVNIIATRSMALKKQ